MRYISQTCYLSYIERTLNYLKATAVWCEMRLKLERASCDMIRDCVFASVISIMNEKDRTREEQGTEINAKLDETCVTI